jgi:hypothetical protein
MKIVIIIIIVCAAFSSHAQQNTKQPVLGNSEAVQPDTSKHKASVGTNSIPVIQISEQKNNVPDSVNVNLPVLMNSAKKEEE